MLDRKYEKFRGGPAKRLGVPAEPRVTLNRHGRFYLNYKAHEMLGRAKAVAFYYNRDDESIAIEPAYERFSENFPVITLPNGHTIYAATFCRHNGISVHRTERFIRPDLTDEGAMILNLRETVTVGAVRQAKKKKPGTV